MKPFPRFLLLFSLLCSATWGADKEVLLDTFETGTPAWSFWGGSGSPQAKGSFQQILGGAHSGTGTAQFSGDFRAGGTYVAAMRDLAPLNKAAVSEFRFWLKAANVTTVVPRVIDATGQTFHGAAVLLKNNSAWQDVSFNVANIVARNNSWGGAKDGRWHGPAQAFHLLYENGWVGSGKQATLLMDDGRVMVPSGTVIPTTSTLNGAVLSQSACRAGYGVQVTYRWDGVPLPIDYHVFVHVLGPNGGIAFQADHELPIATSKWLGRVEYTDGLTVPPGMPAGEYRVIAGLWDPATGTRPALAAGPGATAIEPGACQIAKFQVSANAPLPTLPAPTLNLAGYRVTFDEDFLVPAVNVSAWGPGTRWIAHTPFAGDFGDAQFADPRTGFPFTVTNGVLRIEARKTNGKWESGLLASVDPKGNGFSQRFGYFEMRAKLPKGEGVWPAFWLMGVKGLTDKTITNIEIDVLEQYGARPNTLASSLHFWGPGDLHHTEARQNIVAGMTDAFHRYGVMIDENNLIFYFDGAELRRVPTPPEAKVPVYILADLALGGGWPTTNTPNPSFMDIDYIRVWAKP